MTENKDVLDKFATAEDKTREQMAEELGRKVFVMTENEETWQDWTVAENGRSNSSELYTQLVVEVERLIRQDAHNLIAGRADKVATLIMAQLAHVHHLEPHDHDKAQRVDDLTAQLAAMRTALEAMLNNGPNQLMGTVPLFEVRAALATNSARSGAGEGETNA